MSLDSNEQTLTESPRLVPPPPSTLVPTMQAGRAGSVTSVPRLSPAAALLLASWGVLYPESPSQDSGECRGQTHSGGRKKPYREQRAKGHQDINKDQGGLSQQEL